MAKPMIDPNTGERMPAQNAAPQIDPNTGERVSVAAATVPPKVQPPASPAPKVGSFGDTLSNIGTHLKNIVMGPAHALGDPANDAVEVGLSGAPGGNLALGAYRMLAKPTVEGIQTAVEQGKKGNYGSKNQPEYDASGTYKPTMLSGAADALPIVGPWARGVENDAQQKGMLPALAGLGTDLVAPKVAGKIAGVALRTAGKAAQMASATPPSVKLAAGRALLVGDGGDLLQSGLKPGIKFGANAGDKLAAAVPDLLAQDPNLRFGGVSGFTRAADAARDAAYKPYDNLVAPYRPAPGGIGPVRPGTIDGSPIADAQNASIPAINRFESADPRPSAAPPPVRFSQPAPTFRGNIPTSPSPAAARLPAMPGINEPTGIVANTAAKADLYRKPIGVATADALREDANAKLNAFYNKAGGDQNAALSSPETARVKAIGDTTRQQLYPKLEADANLQPGTVAAMQQKYGNLSEVSEIANKREPVFARHDPVSLSQKIVGGSGNPISMAWNWGVQKALRGLTDSDAQVNVGVDKIQNPAGPVFTPRAGFMPQMGSEIGKGLYGAGKAAGSLPLKFNPLLYSAANPPKR